VSKVGISSADVISSAETHGNLIRFPPPTTPRA
jgi:hypothetical protein